jgi:copper ion binding protein
MKTILNISGMTCNHCVKHVTEALKKLKGIKSVSVSLENNSASIEHKDNLSLEDMKNAVIDAGYEIV